MSLLSGLHALQGKMIGLWIPWRAWSGLLWWGWHDCRERQPEAGLQRAGRMRCLFGWLAVSWHLFGDQPDDAQ